MQSIDPAIDELIGHSLIIGETIVQELRLRLVRDIARNRRKLSPDALVNRAREILSQFEPILAKQIASADLGAWLLGSDKVAKDLPAWAGPSINRDDIPPIPPRFAIGEFFGDEPAIRFPLIENAAMSLIEKQLLTRPDFDRLSAEARRKAFTVAGEMSVDALDTIRNVLVETVVYGPSLGEFTTKLEDAIGKGRLGAAHLENVYRTNIQTAYQNGQDEIASNPIVSEVFPYQEYLAIHDGRVREHHLELETLGLNGTNVYRRDDPFWDQWTPPNGYQCRCATNLLTIEAAADRGVKEAQEWLRTSRPPITPEHRLQFIPFKNEPGFGARRVTA